VADRLRVDFLGAEGFADARKQVAERKDSLHLQFGQREGGGDGLDRPAFLHQPRVAFPLGDGVRCLAQHVLDHRNFERVGIVALGQNDARQGHEALALLRRLKAGEIAPLARDDLEVAIRAIGPDEQRRDYAAPDHRGQNVGDIGRLLALAHVGLAH
jgi:hypothetical protein